jgi:hypothetical protein
MATEITTTSQNITGDFDLVVIGAPSDGAAFTLVLKKALGADAASDQFETAKVFAA